MMSRPQALLAVLIILIIPLFITFGYKNYGNITVKKEIH